MPTLPSPRIFAAVLPLAIVLMVLPPPVAAQGGDYRVARHIPLGGDGGWDYITVDTAANRHFLTRSDRVTVVDERSATGADGREPAAATSPDWRLLRDDRDRAAAVDGTIRLRRRGRHREVLAELRPPGNASCISGHAAATGLGPGPLEAAAGSVGAGRTSCAHT